MSTAIPDPTNEISFELISAALDMEAPVASGSVHDVAGACAWMVARAAGTLAAEGHSAELLDAVCIMTRADCDAAGFAHPRISRPYEPHPATTAVWLVEQKAAGRHEVVDKVMTYFLSVDLYGRAVVLARVAAHFLRLVDGQGAHATLRAQRIAGK